MGRSLSLVTGLLAGVLSTQAVSALTVRVDSSGGAPRLTVNGRPVRARIFYGGVGHAPVPVSPKGEVISLEFTASVGEPERGTIHFRFGQTPGDLTLDDIQLTDLDTGRDVIPRCDFEGGAESFTKDWTFWPTDSQNTVGKVTVKPGVGRDGSAGLHVGLSAPPGGAWPDFHVYHHARLSVERGHRLRLRFWARSEPDRGLKIALYRPGATYTLLAAPGNVFESQIRLAADAGVDFVSSHVPMPWPEPGQAVDWSGVDAACEAVLAANPRALLIPRIGVEPPAWWRKAHPEEMMAYEEGADPARLAPGANAVVVASPLYRRDAAERLAALITHLEEKFGEHIAGYHPCAQHTGEWFYPNSWAPALSGYAPADARGWRAWLRERYGSDAELRRAWGSDTVTRDAAPVPTPEQRRAAPAGLFHDPASERALIDFAEYRQESMADCVRALAKATRQASGGRKLVLFFYGYVFEFGALGSEPATSGHYALRRILDCPDIDMLCSPISYFDRGLGGSAPSMTAAESVALAGKIWLNEDDTHTYLATEKFPGWGDHVSTPAETNAQLVRNTSQAALRNFATWWMDLGSSGWFNDAGMWVEMKRLKALDEALLAGPTPFRPEVAAVVDEGSMLRAGHGSVAVTRPGVYEARGALARLGAPYGQYLQDDVTAGRVRARLYLFLSPWSMEAPERSALLRATEGATRVWCYAPGFFDGYRESSEAMRQLTGFRLEPVRPPAARAEPTEAGKKLGLTRGWGSDKPVRPLFAAADARPGEVLATYPDGSAAVALRRVRDGWSLFVGVPGLTSELLRLAADRAGVHLYTRTDCNVYANGPFVTLHASADGPVALDTGATAPVLDMLTGEKVGTGPKLTLTLKRGETRVLRCR